MTHGPQLGSQLADTFGSPQQGVFGVAGNGWFDKAVNIRQESRIGLNDFLAPSAGPTNPTQGQDFASLNVLYSAPNRESGNPCRLRNQPDASPSYVNGFGGAPDPPTPFGQGEGQCRVLRSNPFEVHEPVYRLSHENVAVIFARPLTNGVSIHFTFVTLPSVSKAKELSKVTVK
jgi:hypothetical protein